MAIDLIDLAKGYLTDSVINSVSGAVGESAAATRNAASGAIPAVLGGLIKKASTADGAGMLASLLDQDHDGSMLDDLGGMLDGEKLSSIADKGSSALSGIFGGGMESIASALGSASGVSAKSSGSILEILAPIVLGVLGKQKKSVGLDTGGLAKLLMSQSESVKRALPAGMSGLLGLGSLGEIGKVAADAGRATAGAVRNSGTAAAVAAGNAGGSMMRKLLPLALLIGAALLLWPTLKGCGQKATDTVGSVAGAAGDMAGDAMGAAGEMADGAVNAAGEMADGAVNAAGKMANNAADAVASLFDYANAPSAADLGVTSGGVMDQFIGFLKSGTGMEKTFTLDKVHFETGSNVLKADSRGQLDEVAKVLDAYEAVNIELQGHTDNEGGTDSNQQLSEQRASAVKIYLESKGIAGDRLSAKGYGESAPAGTNDTAAGRAMNRRTDIRVTQK